VARCRRTTTPNFCRAWATATPVQKYSAMANIVTSAVKYGIRFLN
jgi:hypothetical protein